MAQLTWDDVGERYYETGVKNGVLYPQSSGGTYAGGVAWNGLISVTESPSGAEPTPLYANDIKYLNLLSKEEFACTIEAYTCPDEFLICNGMVEAEDGMFIGQQPRTPFGLAYKTIIGNDVDGNAKGYKIHLVYGCLAAPSEQAHTTINETPEAMTMSWEVSTTPVSVTDHEATATVTIDSTKANADNLAALEAILFGSAEVTARLPLPDEVASTLTTEETTGGSTDGGSGE